MPISKGGSIRRKGKGGGGGEGIFTESSSTGESWWKQRLPVYALGVRLKGRSDGGVLQVTRGLILGGRERPKN